jgi:hypothetical protein
MRPQTRTVQRELARIAGAQHVVVTRAQLLCAGLSANEIKRRVRNGALWREHRGVYPVVETLGRSGLRVSELCDLRSRDARHHDQDGSRFQIADAKTEPGIREVQMTPDLADVLAWIQA